MDIEEVQQKLGEYLASDFENGPFSDTSFARAEVEPDGTMTLFASESESAWPVASFDVPQLAEWLMPLVRRAQASKVREVAELVMDPHNGLPFDAEHDLAIVSAWLHDVADHIEHD